jgi:hypothetical protein
MGLLWDGAMQVEAMPAELAKRQISLAEFASMDRMKRHMHELKASVKQRRVCNGCRDASGSKCPTNTPQRVRQAA